MTTYLWVPFALAHAVVAAGMPLVSEYFQRNSLHLLFWMRFLGALFYVPILFLFAPPTDPVFYLASFITILIFSVTDLVFMGLSAKNGAGLMTRLDPLSAWFTFVFWTALTPSLLGEYFEEPLRGAGIFLSICGTVYFASHMRRCPVGWPAFKRYLPFILATAVGIVFSKTAMDHSPLNSGIFYYGFIQSAGLAVFYLFCIRLNFVPFMNGLEIDGRLFEKRTLLAGGILSLVWCLNNAVKYYGVSLVENPAYVTAVGLTTPFWVLLLYKLLGRREKANVMAGVGVVACTILLIIFTQF